MAVYSEDHFSYVIDEILPMLKEHWEELANNKDVRPLDIDTDTYEALNAIGYLRVFVARDKDAGKIIGYSSWFIANHMHYKTWKVASCDVYYVDPSYRKTGLAIEFFNKIEEWLKSLEVKQISLQDKINHSHGKLFNSLGYKMTENNYEKII